MAAILYAYIALFIYVSLTWSFLPSLVASGPGPVSDSLPDRPPVRATAHVRRLGNEAWFSRMRRVSTAHAQ